MTRTPYLTTFGRRLRTLRLNAGLTQVELARRVGKSKQLISSWELGRSVILATDLVRVTAALGCTADSLLIGALAAPARNSSDIRN